MINVVGATGNAPSLATGTVPSLEVLYIVRLERLRLETSLIFLLYQFAFSSMLALRVKRVGEDVYVYTYF